MPKVTQSARPQGQAKGQRPVTVAAVAAQYHVPVQWLRLIASGTLDDPAFVRAIREAAKVPRLWELVAPAALEALTIPTVKIAHLGGSLDDLLRRLLEVLHDSRRPGAALAHVNTELDLGLEFQRDADADRGRRSLKSTATAAAAKAAKAAERARECLKEVDERRLGVPKTVTYALIARREKLKSGDAVKKRIDRFKKRPRKN